MQRRTLLKLGLGATAVLAVGGGGLAMLRPGLVQGQLTAPAQAVFRAVARAVLDGSLPTGLTERDATLDAHMARLDGVLSAFPAATQAELSQLLALLASAPGRVILAGLRTDWPDASVAELQQSQDAFYGSAEWRDGPREAIVSLIESDISVVIPAESLPAGRSFTAPA